MGRTRIIAETGAGQHGVATATVCARFGLPCVIYMGEVDVERQQPNVFRMKLLGAEVIPVTSGAKTLKDAMNEALRDWVANVDDTFYLIGTAAGPHPYPELVRDFQAVIGTEAKSRCWRPKAACPTCWSRRSVADRTRSGCSTPSSTIPRSRCSASRRPAMAWIPSKHAASLNGGAPGILHGNKTYLLQDEDGQITEAHSISAGLDYPGIGPEHAWLHDIGRVQYEQRDRSGGARRLPALLRLEGIIPALECSHAIAAIVREGAGDIARIRSFCSISRGAETSPGTSSLRRRCAGGNDMSRLADTDVRLKIVCARLPWAEDPAAFASSALVTFVTGGDPTPAATPAILDALVAGGADVIELGMPFTDPMADGPAIQRANLRALAAGTQDRRSVRYRQGFPRAPPGGAAGADGLCQPDAASWRRLVRRSRGRGGRRRRDLRRYSGRRRWRSARRCAAAGIDVIRLATPTTDVARLPAVVDGAGGFLYYVSVAGITGHAAGDQHQHRRSGRAAEGGHRSAGRGRLRHPHARSRPRRSRKVADGVVVGSAIIDLMARACRRRPRSGTDVRALYQQLERRSCCIEAGEAA
jgi:tryptophan synthase alpha subunit